MQLVDTHCHIQEAQLPAQGDDGMRAMWHRDKPVDPDQLITHAAEQGVTKMICVGTTVADSRLAVEFVQTRPQCWASIGLHPHEAKDGEAALQALASLLISSPAKVPISPAQSGQGRKQRLALTPPYGPGEPSLGKRETSAADAKPIAPIASLPANAPEITPAGASLAERNWVQRSAARAKDKLVGEATAETLLSPARNAQFLSARDKAGPASSPNHKIVAIGECGLDYFYNHSSKTDQIKALRFQIELAMQHNLPLIFHVRNALDDFWPIFDSYPNLRGVLHSFTDTQANLDRALARGLYIGVNGIMTFTKDQAQLAMAKQIPLQKLLIETDAPFLTPVPLRGKVNEPANGRLVANFMATLRGEQLKELAAATTTNAQTLFGI